MGAISKAKQSPNPTPPHLIIISIVFFAVNFMITIAMLPLDVCSFASIYINDAADVAPMSLHYAMHSMHATPAPLSSP